MKKYFAFFLQGLVVLAPLGVTVYIFYLIISTVGHILPGNFLINPYIDPIIAVIIAFLIITFVGVFASSFLFRAIYSAFEHAMEKAPFVKIIYSSIKDFLSAFVGSKRKFNKPVIVTLNRENDIRQLGFITQDNLSDMGIPGAMVAVYLPSSYSIAGQTLIMPSQSVQVLNIPASEVMKFIVSGGVSIIE